MKKRTVLMLFLAVFSIFKIMAQNRQLPKAVGDPWIQGGNITGGNMNFGPIDPFSVSFITGGFARGIMTNNGDWGFGTVAPNNVKVHIQSNPGQDGLKVQIGNNIKFRVEAQGGVTVGGGAVPPAGGLYVVERVGIGNSNPQVRLHVMGGTNADLAGGGYILTGQQTGVNLVMDNNDIMARNNGVAAPLNLNRLGGNVGIGVANPTSKLHVAGDVKIGGAGTGVVFDWGPNAQFLRENHVGGLLEIKCHADFVPDNTCTHDLGSPDLKWKNLYLCGQIIDFAEIDRKENVQNLNYGLKEIMKMRPVTYSQTGGAEGKKNIGLIANEVQKVLPEAVADSYTSQNEKTGKVTKFTTAKLGLEYNAILPVLIKAMQEQQQQIDELKQTVEKLSHGQSITTTSTGNESIKTNIAVTNATLEQNKPNPLSNTTSIRYNLPAGAKNARLMITDNSGKTIKQVTLTAGAGVVNIDASALGNGTYQYSLMIDGKRIESKTMVVAH